MSRWCRILLLVVVVHSTPSAWAELPLFFKKIFPPSSVQRQECARLVPIAYQKDIILALEKSRFNGWELMSAIQRSDAGLREAMAFLIVNMPDRDLRTLRADFLIENTHLADRAMRTAPWARTVPQDIFFNNILPYATLNERRDRWRKDFYRRFIGLAQQTASIDEAVRVLNKEVFYQLKVSYSATRRPKPDQSPYESMRAHYASCTGLSILLTDALRAVGIPARIAAIVSWPDGSGNHTWVEIWDGRWHYIGAAEPNLLDHTWFTQKAAHTDAGHPIEASSFKKTDLTFVMRWALKLKYVSAVDVTAMYQEFRNKTFSIDDKGA